ncbi:ISLre2 family transposase [Lactococcus garvieae]|uniref:ISLre2 family transposase n=1 Tax=Lactococcus garvieae TaxID=1363 RepID=UPI003251088D
MNQDVIDERKYFAEFQSQNLEGFYKWVAKYDAYMFALMKLAGWEPAFSKERTVIFTFGEATFTRRAYRKGNRYRYPVDEKLGLEKNARFSKELLYQVVELSKLVVYRRIPDIIELLYQVHITKETVSKALGITTALFNERDAYRFYEEHKDGKKIKAPVIYVEGDGVMVHTKTGEKRWSDLAHFVIHTGSKKVGKSKKRRELVNKIEIISIDWKDALRKLTETLTNFYDLEHCELLVTNSDGGHGYSPHVFKDLAKLLQIEHHEHFWDEYHLRKKIKDVFRGKSLELRELLFDAIRTHNKKGAQMALDTQASLLDTEDEDFEKFSRRLLQNFQYTTPAELRGLSHQGIGIVESQHVKVTVRMKNRKMYWSKRGADTMSRMLVMSKEELRDLWFGSWRQDFEQYKDLPEQATEYLKVVNSSYEPYQGKAHWPDKDSRLKHTP